MINLTCTKLLESIPVSSKLLTKISLSTFLWDQASTSTSCLEMRFSALPISSRNLSLWMMETWNNSIQWVTPEEISADGLWITAAQLHLPEVLPDSSNSLCHRPASPLCKISCKTRKALCRASLLAAWGNSPLAPPRTEILRFLQAAPARFYPFFKHQREHEKLLVVL